MRKSRFTEEQIIAALKEHPAARCHTSQTRWMSSGSRRALPGPAGAPTGSPGGRRSSRCSPSGRRDVHLRRPTIANDVLRDIEESRADSCAPIVSAHEQMPKLEQIAVRAARNSIDRRRTDKQIAVEHPKDRAAAIEARVQLVGVRLLPTPARRSSTASGSSRRRASRICCEGFRGDRSSRTARARRVSVLVSASRD